jgi:AcrR family transcriptional regulator
VIQVAGRTPQPERGNATRELILSTAERLFAERGIHAVSGRQISEAAGQGNNAAVSYHFGDKADLVRAIVRTHTGQMEPAQATMVTDAAGSMDVRVWVACLVCPLTEHLAALGSPTYFARFCVQVTSDPALNEIMIDEAFAAPSLQLLLVGLNRSVPNLPLTVHTGRWAMARHLTAHMCVERERALAEGAPTLQPSWEDLADHVIDAIVGLWLAPVTHRP